MLVLFQECKMYHSNMYLMFSLPGLCCEIMISLFETLWDVLLMQVPSADILCPWTPKGEWSTACVHCRKSIQLHSVEKTITLDSGKPLCVSLSVSTLFQKVQRPNDGFMGFMWCLLDPSMQTHCVVYSVMLAGVISFTAFVAIVRIVENITNMYISIKLYER